MLKGEKVVLGALGPSDMGPLFKWANDVDSISLDTAYRPVDWVGFNNWFTGLGKDASKVVFAIRRGDSAPIVGYVQIININAVHRSGELGVRIGDEADRNQGLGRDAIRLAVRYAWDHLNLNRLMLTTLRTNLRAIAAYRASGFKREGLMRRATFIDGAWRDVVIMAILRPRG